MSIADKLAQLRNEKAAANLKTGEAFLAENGLKPQVTTTPSGLQYQVLQEGSGAKPGPTDTVKCHYHGTLINGTVFDSSVQRGQPASFPLNRVISGWTEALQLMPVGSKWRLFLHPQLAYGNREVSAVIGPNCTLIFDVELLDIVSPAKK
jgi:FKBP-type peptidyl-prolyl cis-trans isomerase FklB